MDTSLFNVKSLKPGENDLRNGLETMFSAWQEVIDFTLEKVPGATLEWNFSKFGWNVRIKDKKRAIIYLMPQSKMFKASFVLGNKATDAALNSNIADAIKQTIQNAPVYAEGRGVRIHVTDKKTVKDLQTLIIIKNSQ